MKTANEHIEELKEVNEFYECRIVNEAINFIKRQGEALHDSDNKLLAQSEIITKLVIENKNLKNLIKEMEVKIEKVLNEF